jgi:hypothetical protein
MAIIALSGKIGSGKDAVGKMIQYLSINRNVRKDHPFNELTDDDNWWLEDSSGWQIKKFAGKLKQVASILTGIPVNLFEDQEFKKTNLPKEWNRTETEFVEQGVYKMHHDTPMTVRQFLQELGTETMREGLHKNVWVNALFADYHFTEEDYNMVSYPKWIITDMRFKNEFEAVKSKGGITVRIERSGQKSSGNHPSETELDNAKFDYTIINDKDLGYLMYNTGEMLAKTGFDADI